MDTRLVSIEEIVNNKDIIKSAGQVLKKGGLVAFPTETVYGLGADALNSISAGKIYKAKGRPSDNPLIIHIAEWSAISKIVSTIPPKGKCLAEAFWPGPLTIIFNKSEEVPYTTTGGLETVAVRMPNHKLALEFIREAGGYVAAPSANTSGKPSPTLAKYVWEDMSGKIDMILDGGLVGIGLESTIIDVTSEVPVLLRPGFITKEMVEEIIGQITIDQTILGGICDEVPKAPGMKYKHYAPKGNLIIVSGETEKVKKKINSLTHMRQLQGDRVGVIGTDETVKFYQAQVVKSVGKRTEEEMIARRLYQILREFDEEDVAHIYSESFEATGIGQAIMNRLLKASGYQVINLE